VIQGNKTLMMTSIVHMLLASGFQPRMHNLPVAEDGELYYLKFPEDQIDTALKQVYIQLNALVGSATNVVKLPVREDPHPQVPTPSRVVAHMPGIPVEFMTPRLGRRVDRDGDAVMQSASRVDPSTPPVRRTLDLRMVVLPTPPPGARPSQHHAEVGTRRPEPDPRVMYYQPNVGAQTHYGQR
jgi:hypothetical protein